MNPLEYPPNRDSELLRNVIRHGAGILKESAPPTIDPLKLLGALAEIESSFGEWNIPKVERAYLPGGLYYRFEQVGRYRAFGALAACSYSSFQLLYPTACELGYASTRFPLELWYDDIAILFVCEYIKKRAFERGATTPEQVFDAYNSGNFRDANVPTSYIDRGMESYGVVLQRRGFQT